MLVVRWRGLAALAGLGVTYLVLMAFLLSALLDGRSPVLAGLTAATAILFVVLYLAHGVSPRTSAALLGTLLSLALTGVLTAGSPRPAGSPGCRRRPRRCCILQNGESSPTRASRPTGVQSTGVLYVSSVVFRSSPGTVG